MGLIDTMDQIAANLEAQVGSIKKKNRGDVRKAQTSKKQRGKGVKVKDVDSNTGYSFIDKKGRIARDVKAPKDYEKTVNKYGDRVRARGLEGASAVLRGDLRGGLWDKPTTNERNFARSGVEDAAAEGAGDSAPANLLRAIGLAGGAVSSGANYVLGDDIGGQAKDAVIGWNPFTDSDNPVFQRKLDRGGWIDNASSDYAITNIPENLAVHRKLKDIDGPYDALKFYNDPVWQIAGGGAAANTVAHAPAQAGRAAAWARAAGMYDDWAVAAARQNAAAVQDDLAARAVQAAHQGSARVVPAGARKGVVMGRYNAVRAGDKPARGLGGPGYPPASGAPHTVSAMGPRSRGLNFMARPSGSRSAVPSPPPPPAGVSRAGSPISVPLSNAEERAIAEAAAASVRYGSRPLPFAGRPAAISEDARREAVWRAMGYL